MTKFKFKIKQQVMIDLGDGWEIRPVGTILNRREKQNYEGTNHGMSAVKYNEYLVLVRGEEKLFKERHLEEYVDENPIPGIIQIKT